MSYLMFLCMVQLSGEKITSSSEGTSLNSFAVEFSKGGNKEHCRDEPFRYVQIDLDAACEWYVQKEGGQ